MKTFSRPIWTAVLLAVIVCLGVAGTKISRLTTTSTIEPNSLFLVVTGSVTGGTTATRAIEATNLLNELIDLPNWPTTGQASVTNAVGTVKTNGTTISSAATSLDIIAGTNVVVRATNASGVVTMEINTASSTGGGSSLVTNANQFGASTTLTIKSAARLTNAVLWGTTSGELLYLTNGLITPSAIVVSGGGTLDGAWTFNGTIDGTSTNFISSLAEDTGPQATDYTWTEDRSGAQLVKVKLGAIYFNAANYLTNWANAVSNYVDTASSNRVRLVGGTGGITVSQSGSGGVQTWTINDDDAGGGSTTNFTTLGVGSITVGSLQATQRVQTGQLEVRTNAFVDRLTVTNWVSISGPQTNTAATYKTSTLNVDGVVTFNSDLNIVSALVNGSNFTASSQILNSGRRVETIDKVGTTISVALGAGPGYSIATNQTITFTFSGTPLHGQQLSLMVSNTATTNFLIGIPSTYSPQVRSNVTAWTVAASNYVVMPFIYTTNEVGGGIWVLGPVSELGANLAVASAGANGFLTMLTNAGGNIITVSNAYIPQGSSITVSNLAGTGAFTNGLVSGWGVTLVTNSGVVSPVLTNRPASIATNATSVTLDFSDTANIQILNAWFHLTTNLVVSPTNLVVGRTMAVYFDTNSLTYDVTFTNTAANRVNWNFNVSTNGSTSFTKTNTMRARVFLTAETNGVISAEMGYYR